MSDALDLFPPSRSEAHARLHAFAPKAGQQYTTRRNYDLGPGAHDNVSVLSPYLKTRLLDETAVVRGVLAHHTAESAEKFIAEVFWRTYWKGWMELRPGIWQQYLHDLNRLHDDVQTQSGLRNRWEEACLGQTGLAPFDAWTQELVRTGYLHNHARMWFASIWIFTLELPWQLGADFFLRHLLDGDAAVNTLSWRWVAGIQTKGKTYLARPDNIAKYTNRRFPDVEGLAQQAIPCEAPDAPPAGVLLPCESLPLGKRYGILLHGDDLDVARLLDFAPSPVALAYADATSAHSPWEMAPHVGTFRHKAAQDAVPQDTEFTSIHSAQQIADWARAKDLDQIVAPYAPVGPVQQMFTTYRALPEALPLNLFRRPLDSFAWPLATKGFFPFRKHIPDFIGKFARS